MWRQVLMNSRYLVLIAVAGSLIGSIAVLIYGALTVVSLVVDAFRNGAFTTEGARYTAVHAIEMIDLFLLGTVLLIYHGCNPGQGILRIDSKRMYKHGWIRTFCGTGIHRLVPCLPPEILCKLSNIPVPLDVLFRE